MKAQAHADAQAHLKDEVSRILASERAAALDSAHRAVLRERIAAEEEQRQTKLLVSDKSTNHPLTCSLGSFHTCGVFSFFVFKPESHLDNLTF